MSFKKDFMAAFTRSSSSFQPTARTKAAIVEIDALCTLLREAHVALQEVTADDEIGQLALGTVIAVEQASDHIQDYFADEGK